MDHETQKTKGASLPVRLGGRPAVDRPEPHSRWPVPDPRAEVAVAEMMRSSELSYFRLDGKVREFEDAYRQQMGLPYAVTTHSGTAAIHAGWFGLDLAPGTEVIAPAYTHIGTVMPLFHLGLIPVLCDIDADTGNIDPQAIRAQVTERTGAIGVTHQFGLSARMEEIVAIAREHDLRILEDCSHAHGAFYQGQPVGTKGDVACFSLQAHKTVPVGEGGILLTAEAGVAERASLLGHFRQPRDFSSDGMAQLVETGYGMKSRLHPLAAAIGVVALENMREVCAKRNRNHQRLNDLIEPVPGLTVLPTPGDCDRGGFFRFVLKVDERHFAGLNAEQVVAAVQDEGAAEVRPGSLARCLQSYKIFQDASVSPYRLEWRNGSDPLRGRPVYRPGDFPASEAFSATTIQMPAFTDPSEQLIEQYAAAFAKVQAHAADLVAHY